MLKENEELQNKIKQSNYSVKSKKMSYENQIKEFKKEIDKLVKSNEALKRIIRTIEEISTLHKFCKSFERKFE